MLQHFRALGAEAHGVDLDEERVAIAHRTNPLVRQGSAESLPYPDSFFDLVFANEVLEHVDNDAQAVRECFRAVAPGGHLAFYVPNRLYPFETHGCYWRGDYRFGNIPLINYLPTAFATGCARTSGRTLAGSCVRCSKVFPDRLLCTGVCLQGMTTLLHVTLTRVHCSETSAIDWSKRPCSGSGCRI